MDTYNKLRIGKFSASLDAAWTSGQNSRVQVGDKVFAEGGHNQRGEIVALGSASSAWSTGSAGVSMTIRLDDGRNVTLNHGQVCIPLNTGINQAHRQAVCERVTKWYEEVHGIGVGNASNEKQEADDMADLLHAYWKLAAKRVSDNVPMILDQVMMQPIVQEMQAEMLSLSSSEEELETLFTEARQTIMKREQLGEKRKRLEKAEDAIMTVTDARATLVPTEVAIAHPEEKNDGLSFV